MIIKVLKRKKGKGYITTEFLKNAKNHSCCIFFIVFLGSTATSFFSRPGRFRIWCHLSSLFSANWLGDEAGVHFQAFEGVQFASTSSHFKPMKCGSTNRPLIEPIVYLAAHELEDTLNHLRTTYNS